MSIRTGMLCHSNFCLWESFKLQPFITDLAFFLGHLFDKALPVAVPRLKAEGPQKGKIFLSGDQERKLIQCGRVAI